MGEKFQGLGVEELCVLGYFVQLDADFLVGFKIIMGFIVLNHHANISDVLLQLFELVVIFIFFIELGAKVIFGYVYELVFLEGYSKGQIS